MSLTSKFGNRSTCMLTRIIANQHFCLRYLTTELQKSKCNYSDVFSTNLVNRGRRNDFHNLDLSLGNNLTRSLSSQSKGFYTQDGSPQTSSSCRPLEANIAESSSINEARIASEETGTNSSVTNHLKSELFFYGPSCSAETKATIGSSFIVFPDFITADEEVALLQEVEPHLKRLPYEFDHWDDAIKGFRETEVSRWSSVCSGALQRLRDTAFSDSGSEVLVHTHILDLAEDGHIKPHIDSGRFCGTIISGLSLGSAAIMRLAREDAPIQAVDVILPRRSLYVMRDEARYQYTHEVLSNSAATHLPDSSRPHRGRRVSVICRNHPT